MQLQPPCSSYPDDPRVHRAKHGTLVLHCPPHLVHVVQQPAELHRTEVGADGKTRLVLERTEEEHNLDILKANSRTKSKR